MGGSILLFVWVYASLGAAGVLAFGRKDLTRRERLGLWLILPGFVLVFAIPMMFDGKDSTHG